MNDLREVALRAALAQQEPGGVCGRCGGWVCDPVLVQQERGDGMPASADERHLRKLLAVRVGIPGAYYDDGEAQGAQHGISIDFMREPVADIDAKLRALNVARAALAQRGQPEQAWKFPKPLLQWAHTTEDGEPESDWQRGYDDARRWVRVLLSTEDNK